MTAKQYPLHHEDASPMYVNIPIEEYKRTAKKLLDAAATIMDKDKEIESLKNAQRWRKFSEE
ncbi:MAG: hypothetical protein IKS96_00480, partial [Fibrobacter sp.]|nr:hypothetical protein [Fibrobacter sp.]